MTESLQRAFDAASQLPTDEQDAIATWMLSELGSERKWSQLFQKSAGTLASLAGEALAEHARGETQNLESQ